MSVLGSTIFGGTTISRQPRSGSSTTKRLQAPFRSEVESSLAGDVP